MWSQVNRDPLPARGRTAVLPLPSRGDIVTAVSAGVLDFGAFMVAWFSDDIPQPPLLVLVYTVLMCGPVAWRHHYPLPVYAVTLVLHFAFPFITKDWRTPLDPSLGETYVTLAHMYTPVAIMLVALAAVASDCPLRWSVPAALAGVAGWIAIYIINGVLDVPNLALVMLAAFFATWLVGTLTGRSVRRIHTLETSQAQAEAAIAKEHALIASELHDIVSHAVTVMTLHAAGARRVIKDDPERAEQALNVIEATGTQAMDELRRLLDALHTGDARFPGPSSLPGIDMAGPLLEWLREAGFRVDWRVEGEPRVLADSVNHTAYRVIQESLTNVAKHSGRGAQVDVVLRWVPGSLAIDITDDGGHGRRPEQQHHGFGLVGLRERVAIVGGSLTFGHEGPGFGVHVELPLGIAQPHQP